VALILDKRAAATLEDCVFFGAAASDDDVDWLHGDSVKLSAAAVCNATECLALARQWQQQQQREGGRSPALQIVCAVKSVSSAAWCAAAACSHRRRGRSAASHALICRRSCAVCSATAAVALEDEAVAPGVKDTACRNVTTLKMRCPEI
jgi:hypothetical protein